MASTPLPETPSTETQTVAPPLATLHSNWDPMTFLPTLLRPSERPDDLGRLGDFQIRRILGAGGMGVVLEAWDAVLNRKVALKLMRPEVARNPTSKQRFLREARAMAAIEHPRIVIVHQVGEFESIPFLLMPLMVGESLADRLKSGPPIPLGDAIRFAWEAADGLAAAHAKGVVHRDVKPDNIWLEQTAEGVHIRLLDFGLARDDAAESLTQSGAVFGTPAYMAPEQAAGERVDGRADLFSLGCVLYEMVTHTRAFSGPSMTAILYALANHTPPPASRVNPLVPEPLSRLIEELLAKNRDQRPRSAAEVATALRSMESESPAAATTAAWPPSKSAVPTTTDRIARHRLTIAAAVLLTATLGLLATLEWNASPPSPESDRGSTPGPTLPTPSPEPGRAPLPLKVTSIDVRHFSSTPDGDVFSGILGRHSFAPKLGDRVQVVAKLSRPAYAYLLAFRPDGQVEVCYPEHEEIPPTLTDSPRYPTDEGGKAYGLREGAGLWVFAVVASDQPLPPYKDWATQHNPPWSSGAADGGAVWWYDGGWLETLGEGLPTTRGKGEELTGAAAAVLSLGQWLRRTGSTAGVIGFGVGPEPTK